MSVENGLLDFLEFVDASKEACICLLHPDDLTCLDSLKLWGNLVLSYNDAIQLLQSNSKTIFIVNENNLNDAFSLIADYNESAGLIQKIDPLTNKISLHQINIEKAKLLLLFNPKDFQTFKEKYPFSSVSGGVYQ